MRSLSSVGLGLSIVFGGLLLALVAELYYLLWRKKRFARTWLCACDQSDKAKEFLFMFCWRKPSTLSHPVVETASLGQDSNKDLVFKPFGNNDDADVDCTIETELLRLQNLSGPPRFLFTIMEETKEDLESEDGKSTRSRVESRWRSLSDLLMTAETPYLTPTASPSMFTPPLTPVKSSSLNQQQSGFNPLFESEADAEFNRMRSSPPPKFKFLQQAEEKLQRRKMVEEAQKSDGSFITIVVDKSKERGFNHHHHQQQFNSVASQVLPLPSSP